jgi:uncharacterized membrane protein YbhN (UPF0104 family)
MSDGAAEGAAPARPWPAAAWRHARRIGRERRKLITIVGSLLAAGVLVAILWGRRDQFATAISSASIVTLLTASGLQLVALLARTEAWHICIEAAGGTVERRVLYRASSMGYVGSLLNAQVGAAARIAALRRSSPAESPGVSTLIAAEFPILAVEGTLAALASFTLVVPLGLPWWLPVVFIATLMTLSSGLRHLALREGRELWSGLAVLRSVRGGGRLVAFVMVAVFAQILRNWLLLHAVGVDASVLDATALLIAMVSLAQLPIGPSSGAASAVLILGQNGVAAVAAAGVLSTATGMFGGLTFAAWAGADRLWAGSAARVALRGRQDRAQR